jgi:hypothetical protein
LAGEGSERERGLHPLSKSLPVVTGVSKRGARPSFLFLPLSDPHIFIRILSLKSERGIKGVR